GIAVARQTQSSPFLGLNAQPGDSGKLVVQGVVPGSAAEAAGLEPGDMLLKVGEIETRPDEDWGVKFRDRYRGQAGAPAVSGSARTRRGRGVEAAPGRRGGRGAARARGFPRRQRAPRAPPRRREPEAGQARRARAGWG